MPGQFSTPTTGTEVMASDSRRLLTDKIKVQCFGRPNQLSKQT